MNATFETKEITPDIARSWKLPGFQRELQVNAKLMSVARDIKDGGVIPGIITLGSFDGSTYVIDGQHRLHAFILSEAKSCLCDLRILKCETIGEMSREFELLQSHIVRMRPDDHLRAIAERSPLLQRLQQEVSFVGFDMIRRGEKSPVLSMSMVLRCWVASGRETPSVHGATAVACAEQLIETECENLIKFLHIAMNAWGRDREFIRLWGALNFTLCAWLFRRMVLGEGSSPFTRTTRLTPESFQKCITGLSADSAYLDWLVGRNFGDRSRSPGLARMKTIFARRMVDQGIAKPMLPQPAWSGKTSGP
jgi:hypothetical protein